LNPKLKVTGPAALGHYLIQNLHGFKRAKIKQMLKFGSVRVNSRVVTLFSHPVRRGDVVDFLNKKEAVLQQVKKKQPFRIIYEDATLIVVDKPAGLLTVGSDHEKRKTLYFILNEYARLQSRDDKSHMLIVHRLDRDTSGFVVLAKTPAAQEKLQHQWPQVVKKYYAVVEGIPHKKEGTIESELLEDKFKRVYSIRTPAPESKHAVTHYRVLLSGKKYSLLEATLQTGRKNQIRVHFADRSLPIAGDHKYGAKTDPLERLALHAGYLAIPHPVTGERLTFGPQIPEPFKNLVNKN